MPIPQALQDIIINLVLDKHVLIGSFRDVMLNAQGQIEIIPHQMIKLEQAKLLFDKLQAFKEGHSRNALEAFKVISRKELKDYLHTLKPGMGVKDCEKILNILQFICICSTLAEQTASQKAVAATVVNPEGAKNFFFRALTEPVRFTALLKAAPEEIQTAIVAAQPPQSLQPKSPFEESLIAQLKNPALNPDERIKILIDENIVLKLLQHIAATKLKLTDFTDIQHWSVNTLKRAFGVSIGGSKLTPLTPSSIADLNSYFKEHGMVLERFMLLSAAIRMLGEGGQGGSYTTIYDDWIKEEMDNTLTNMIEKTKYYQAIYGKGGFDKIIGEALLLYEHIPAKDRTADFWLAVLTKTGSYTEVQKKLSIDTVAEELRKIREQQADLIKRISEEIAKIADVSDDDYISKVIDWHKAVSVLVPKAGLSQEALAAIKENIKGTRIHEPTSTNLRKTIQELIREDFLLPTMPLEEIIDAIKTEKSKIMARKAGEGILKMFQAAEHEVDPKVLAGMPAVYNSNHNMHTSNVIKHTKEGDELREIMFSVMDHGLPFERAIIRNLALLQQTFLELIYAKINL